MNEVCVYDRLCVNKVCVYDGPPFPSCMYKGVTSHASMRRASQHYHLYHLNATNSIISMPRTESRLMHQRDVPLNTTTFVISTSRTLSTQRHELSHVASINGTCISYHELYHLKATNWVMSCASMDVHLTMTHFIISTLRTLLSQCHELCHLMRPRHTAMWISHILSSRTLSSQFHKMYHINVTNCII